MDRRRFLVADLFCGAGGFSTSCQHALAEIGIEMELVCVNHWGRAIETHRANHPHARHYCEDIAAVRPHIVVPEGRLDVLTASPSCTHHSVARGGKPTSDQQRADPWHIITWLTELDVTRLAIENVWEFTSWGPVDPETRRPIRERKGEYFDAWINVIRGLGYEPEWRKVNAADFGEAQTRVRFLLMARKDGKRLVWPVPTHAKRTGEGSLFADLKPWRPAREIIDWSIKGKSILGRTIPLAPKTLARILAGGLKFGWPFPFIRVILRAIDESLRYHLKRNFDLRHEPGKKGEAAAAKARDHAGALRHFRAHPLQFAGGAAPVEPMLVTLRNNADGRSVNGPTPALAANGQHIGLAEPVFINGRKGNQAKPVSGDPVPALDTKGGVWLAQPMVLSQHGSGAARSTEEPGPTITTGGAASEKRQGCARPMVVEPVVLTVAHGNDKRERDPNSGRANSPDVPLGTLHGDGVPYGLAQPFMLSRHADGAPRSTEDPGPTQVAKHSTCLVTAYYGANESCKPVDDPLDTVPTKDRFGLVVPVTHSQGGNACRSTDDPLNTLTTAKGGELAVVVPLTHAGGLDRVINPDDTPLPTATGANRGELAFIAAQFGEREGQTPRVHDLGQPSPSVTATGHMNLVEAIGDAQDDGCDVLFRMFETHELAAAQGMDGYIFTGTKTEIVKQIGNGVSEKKMRAHLLALCADAAPAPFQRAAD